MAESRKKVGITEPPRRRHSNDPSIAEEQVAKMKGGGGAQTTAVTARDTASGVWGGCLGPVLMLFRKKPPKKVAQEDDHEVNFDELKDNLRFIGAGGQGAVYVGVYRGEPVAVKKVKEARDTEISHLMRLKHPNIVQFRLVGAGSVLIDAGMHQSPAVVRFALLQFVSAGVPSNACCLVGLLRPPSS